MTKIVYNDVWANIFYCYLVTNVRDLIWKCNLSAKHIHKILKPGTDRFWVQVLKAWAEYNYMASVNDEHIRGQCLWYNSHIMINKCPFVFFEAFQSGLMYISDLFKITGIVKTYNEITTQFGPVLNWFEYRQLLKAIPKEWIEKCSILQQFCFTNFERLCNMQKISNTVYSELIEDCNALQGRLERWKCKLVIDIEYKDFLKTFKGIYCQTICTKYRDFQYRLLMGILPTNRLLYLWNLVDTQLCTFCHTQVEDELHLFVECKFVKMLWNLLKIYIGNNDRQAVCTQLTWSSKNIIFSRVHPNIDHVIIF